jgi:hypothetical protein
MAEAVTKLPTAPERIPILFPLGDRLIDGAVIRPLSFSGFVDCVTETQNMASTKTFEARLKRARMARQVAFYVGNTVTPVSSDELLLMPIPAAIKLLAKLEVDPTPAGKIIRTGDGIEKAITFELGTPIPVGQNKPPIKELEFHAKTYGDIEDVLAAPSRIHQALMLISTIATPLGTSLSQLPSWAASQVMSADGFAIASEVVPLFCESPAEP